MGAPFQVVNDEERMKQNTGEAVVNGHSNRFLLAKDFSRAIWQSISTAKEKKVNTDS